MTRLPPRLAAVVAVLGAAAAGWVAAAAGFPADAGCAVALEAAGAVAAGAVVGFTAAGAVEAAGAADGPQATSTHAMTISMGATCFFSTSMTSPAARSAVLTFRCSYGRLGRYSGAKCQQPLLTCHTCSRQCSAPRSLSSRSTDSTDGHSPVFLSRAVGHDRWSRT